MKHSQASSRQSKLREASSPSLRTSLVALLFAFSCCASLAENPSPANPALQAGLRLLNQKQYKAASQVLAPLAERGDDPKALYYSGLSLHYLGDITKAGGQYCTLIERFPDSPEARLALPTVRSHGWKVNARTVPTGGARSPNVGTVPTGELSRTADARQIISYLRDFSMSDAEWKATPDEVKVPFKRATSSHLFVNGSVNGRGLQMMFDTGAEQCHFSRQSLEALGVKVDPNGPRIACSGVGGLAYSRMMTADIAVGDLHRRIPVLVDDESVGMPIVGETFFKEFRYDVDNSSGFIRFLKKPRAGSTSHSYESTDVISVPYKSMGDNMVVSAKVNGKAFPMIFDTGSYAIVLSLIHARALGITIPENASARMTSGAGGSVPAYEFTVDRIELGPIIKSHVSIVVNLSDTPSLPLLGQPFYSDRRFTVDTEKHLIKFAH